MGKTKMISVIVPVYNEIDNLDPAYNRIKNTMDSIDGYDYEIVFFDDGSTDGSADKISDICGSDTKCKAVFFDSNYGYSKTVFYSFTRAKGDCAVMIHADMQNPPELIPDFIKEWENGAQIVLGVKKRSRENRIVFFLRTVFYYLMRIVFGVPLIPHATEFELFDRTFLDHLRYVKTSRPFLRGVILKYGRGISRIYYTQDKRDKGKSHFNFSKYYDFATDCIVSCSRCLPRRFILVSVVCIVLLLIEFFAVCLPGLFQLSAIEISNAILLRSILLIILILFIFVSIISEFVIAASDKPSEGPLVTELKNINY